MQVHSRKYYKTSVCVAASLAILLTFSIFLSASLIVGAKADTETGDEPLIILENSTQKRWSQLAELDIFANADYNNEHIIAPYSQGEYSFTVQNTARFPLRCVMSFSDENEYGVPMEFRLRGDSGYISGSDSEWLDCADLTDLTSDLKNESSEEYVLEWRWPGDVDNERDTKLGMAAVEKDVHYIMNIAVTAEQTGEPVEPTVEPTTEPTVEPTVEPTTEPTVEPTTLVYHTVNEVRDLARELANKCRELGLEDLEDIAWEYYNKQYSSQKEIDEAYDFLSKTLSSITDSTEPVTEPTVEPTTESSNVEPATAPQNSVKPSDTTAAQTGDGDKAALWMALAVVSALVFALTLMFRRREQSYEEIDNR